MLALVTIVLAVSLPLQASDSVPMLRVQPAAPPAGEAEPPAPAPRVVEFPAVRVALAEAGAAPREALRYRLEPGLAFRTSMRLERTMTDFVGTERLASERPIPLRLELAGRVDARDEAGRHAVEVTVVRAVPEAVRGANADELERLRIAGTAMEGSRFDVTVDDRGRVSRLSMPEPALQSDAVRPLLRDLARVIERLFVPLPEEPVGAGAVWRVEGDRRHDALLLAGAETVRLRAVDGMRIRLTADGKVESLLQRLSEPPLDGPLLGVFDPRLVHGVVRTGIDATIDLTSPFAFDGRFEWSRHMLYLGERNDVRVDHREIGLVRVESDGASRSDEAGERHDTTNRPN